MEIKCGDKIKKIKDALSKFLPEQPNSIWLKENFLCSDINININLFKSFMNPIRDFIFRGGKHWRSLLSLLLCEGFDSSDSVLKLIPLIEFTHNASLIHDDIEDNSDMRRGEHTMHIKYGTDVAINIGSLLYFLSSTCINLWDANINLKFEVYKLWTNCVKCLHLGQAIDIYWHKESDLIPSIEDYNNMCRLKTGCLISFAVDIAIFSALNTNNLKYNDSKKLATIFDEAAKQIGFGFQILDDVKNIKNNISGKTYGDDILEGKKSFPIIFYLSKKQEMKNFVVNFLKDAKLNHKSREEIKEFVLTLNKDNILDECESYGTRIIEKAIKVFENKFINKDSQNLIIKLIKSISN
jgi:octaprenyl-diphosphate synthase